MAGKIKKAFANTEIYSVYGLIEAGPRVSYLKPDEFQKLDGSLSLPLKNENGYLHICGRADDMIIKAGMNIYPKEQENVCR